MIFLLLVKRGIGRLFVGYTGMWIHRLDCGDLRLGVIPGERGDDGGVGDELMVRQEMAVAFACEHNAGCSKCRRSECVAR